MITRKIFHPENSKSVLELQRYLEGKVEKLTTQIIIVKYIRNNNKNEREDLRRMYIMKFNKNVLLII